MNHRSYKIIILSSFFAAFILPALIGMMSFWLIHSMEFQANIKMIKTPQALVPISVMPIFITFYIHRKLKAIDNYLQNPSSNNIEEVQNIIAYIPKFFIVILPAFQAIGTVSGSLSAFLNHRISFQNFIFAQIISLLLSITILTAFFFLCMITLEKWTKSIPHDNRNKHMSLRVRIFICYGISSLSIIGMISSLNMALSHNLQNVAGQTSIIYSRNVFIVIMSIAIVLVNLLLLLLQISTPIYILLSNMKDISHGDGDLTKKLDVLSRDELGKLSFFYNEFGENIRQLVLNLKESADNMVNYFSELNETSLNIDIKSTEVADAIENVAQGAGSQAENMSNIRETLFDFNEKLSELINAIKNVEENAKKTDTIIIDSAKKLDILDDSTVSIGLAFVDINNRIDTLDKDLNQIDDITNLINSMASQTNLLSLNASIEAARAGEAGKGFSVVADEIRKLAEQSTYSSTRIKGLLERISQGIAGVVYTTNSASKNLDKQIELINSSISSVKEVITSVGEIVPKIEYIYSLTGNINEKKNLITQNIEESAAVSQETSATSEEIAASSEDMHLNISEITAIISNLGIMAKGLKQQINRFKT